MTLSTTLPTTPFESPALDYASLRQEGLRLMERLAGQVWTDFNAHDPGITILEQFCYALTDLAYRIHYDLPDLLASGHAGTTTLQDGLFPPDQILPAAPLTLLDWRKMILDVPGVKNAWVEKVGAEEANPLQLYYYPDQNVLSLQGDALLAEPVLLKGLYRVFIDLSDLLYLDGSAEEREGVVNEVVRRLHAQRGLGEDFVQIQQLDPQEIQIQARLEIDAVDDVERVLLQLYQAVADYISPPIPKFTLSQLLEKGQRINEIFDGPRLENGFIDSAALKQAQRRSELRVSDLIQVMMDVPGVKAVRTISLSAGGQTEDWLLKLDLSKTPKFDLTQSSIQLERNSLNVSLDTAQVQRQYYQALREADQKTDLQGFQNLAGLISGQDRQVGQYYPIQHQFPDSYGLGAGRLPASASPERQAQAKQLQAYLLFFEQLLANYFAQLAHVKDLFAISGHDPRSYFSQVLDDPTLGLDDLRQFDLATHQARLQQITENPYQAPSPPAGAEDFDFTRRNRFLNHLLARFAEQFTDYSLVLYGALTEAVEYAHASLGSPAANGGTPANGIPSEELDAIASAKLVQDKQNFLQAYPYISAARGCGFNYLQPWGSQNRSGLEARLARKLGIEEASLGSDENFYLVEHILLRPLPGDETQKIPFLANPRLKDPYSLQLSFVLPDWTPHTQDPTFKTFAERTIREETPAHLVINIHWLDRDRMKNFETAYHNWLDRWHTYWTMSDE